MAYDSVSVAKEVFEKLGDEIQTEITMADLDSVSTAQQGEEVELDWISELPDELLIDIVSRLTMVEAFRTSVLSSRWIDLWKSAVSVLDFDGSEELLALFKVHNLEDAQDELPERSRRYMNWVNGVVTQVHQSCSTLSKFRVVFYLPIECNSEGDIDRWLNFAISKRVESLHLIFNLDIFFIFWDYYVFSEECYNHIKTPAGMHDITLLRSLRLSCVDVRGEILEHFIANCPVLEELAVKSSEGLKKLKVVGSSHAPLPLKHLEVRSCRLLKSVEIDYTPHLERLIYEGSCQVKEIQVGNCPSLVDLTCGNGCISLQTLRALSGCASRLVSLFLLVNIHDFAPLLGVAEHSKLERLSVQVQRCGTSSILGLIPLINVCPRLHTLQLFFHIPYEIGTRWDVDVGMVNERRDSIKVVEVVGFRGYDIDYEFMEYVIEYFVGLEKIVIDWSTTSPVNGRIIFPCSEEQLCEAEKRALELKSRASPTVEFLVI